MAFTPGFYIPDAPPPAAGGGGGEIDIDPAALEQLKTELRLAAEELEDQRFGDVRLDDQAFGACPTGVELSNEHRTAHAIISDTIKGVVADLWGYREGVALFESGMGSADDTAADDLRRNEEAVAALQASAASNHADTSYRSSQVNHLLGDAGTGEAAAGEGPSGAADTGDSTGGD